MADAAQDDMAPPADPPEPVDDPPRPEEEPGGSRVVRFLAALLGGVTLVGGLTWILINLQAPKPAVDVVVGVVLAAGGLILLMPHRVRLPRAAAWSTAAATAVLGTLAGALYYDAYLCCSYAYVEQRGFPFKWLSHGASAGAPDTARTLAASAPWHTDVPTLAMTALVWAYAGIVVVALVSGLRRRRR